MKISGVEIPSTYTLKKDSLPLRGAALRTKLFMKTYIAIFYSEKDFQTVHDALMDDSPKAIRQHVMTNLITGVCWRNLSKTV